MMIQYFILTFLVGIIPFCLGMAPIHLMEQKHRTIGMTYTSGWLVMFGIFQLTAIPFIVLEKEFATLVVVYSILLFLVSLLGVFMGGREFIDCIKRLKLWKDKEKVECILWTLVVVLILLQIFFSYHMQYLDGDDAFFGAIALGTQNGDGMYLKNPYYGYAQPLDTRHALSPVPIFIAWMGRLTGMHTTILSHSFLGGILILLMYVIYGQLGRVLFPKNKKNVPLFLLFLNLWYLFGNVSLFTAETFAYTRTWQGKAMFGNLVVPWMILWLLFAVKREMKKGEWILLFFLSAVAALTTSTGIFMFPILFGVSALITAVVQKRINIVWQFAVCCIPSIVYGCIYLFMK